MTTGRGPSAGRRSATGRLLMRASWRMGCAPTSPLSSAHGPQSARTNSKHAAKSRLADSPQPVVVCCSFQIPNEPTCKERVTPSTSLLLLRAAKASKPMPTRLKFIIASADRAIPISLVAAFLGM